ncbi:MAG: PAS domain-containing protein, partial [Planctomycetia bacterium]
MMADDPEIDLAVDRRFEAPEAAARRQDDEVRELLAAFTETTRDGLYLWKPRERSLVWNDRQYDFLGIPPRSQAPTVELWFSRVPPADLVPVKKSFNAAVECRQTYWEGEYRYHRGDGAVLVVADRSRLDYDDVGLLRVCGTVTDITRERRAEEALRRSEARLLATLQNAPHVAVQWMDPDGRVVFWNNASERLYGWSAAEAHGKSLDQFLMVAEEYPEFHEKLTAVAATGRPCGPFELLVRHRDGGVGWCLSSLFAIPVADHQNYVVCMDVDMTSRKRTEEALRESNDRYRSL